MLLSLALILTMTSCIGGIYTPIGSGGPCGDDGKYSINPGVSDSSICGAIYLEGYVFEFKGHIVLDDYTYRFDQGARILVRNFTDVKCKRDRRGFKTCDVAGGAYLVDNAGEVGDLFYVKGVKIRPDIDEAAPGSGWQYLGPGYITKNDPGGEISPSDSSLRGQDEDLTLELESLNQTITGLMNASARLNSSIRNLSRDSSNLNDSIINLVQEADSLSAELKASDTLSDETKGKADGLVERLGGVSNISTGFASDLVKAESELAYLTRGIEDLKTAREAFYAYLGDLSKGSTNLAGDFNDTIPKCQYELNWSGPDIICG